MSKPVKPLTCHCGAGAPRIQRLRRKAGCTSTYQILCASCGNSITSLQRSEAIRVWNDIVMETRRRIACSDPLPSIHHTLHNAPPHSIMEVDDKDFRQATSPGPVDTTPWPEKVELPSDPKVELLDAAKAVCTGDRRRDYGDALGNHSQVAALWRSYLGDRPVSSITAEDAAVMMVLVKIARLAKSPAHYDSMVDLAGYAAVMAEICESRKSFDL